jgi:CRISPR-associated endonuclease Cas1
MVSGIGSRNRMNQYDTFREEFKVTYLQRQLLHSKFQSQINFLSTLENDCGKVISHLKSLQKIIPNLTLRRLVSLEAQASREYFKLYASFFDEKYQFDTRNSISKTKQDASDVINALLNYGYSVLASEITKHLNGIGLDPYYSFYHHNHESFQSLTYDMIEPFRWLVEKTVYRLANAKNHALQIKKKHYIKHDSSGMILLDTDLVKKFLEMLEVDFRKTRQYERKNGMRKENIFVLPMMIDAKKFTCSVHPIEKKIQFDLITSFAMFYDVDDPNSFCGDISKVLKKNGIWILELSYFPLMLKNLTYDQICHEHATYYTLRVFKKINSWNNYSYS